MKTIKVSFNIKRNTMLELISSLPDLAPLAQSTLPDGIKGVVKTLQIVSVVLAVGCLIMAGVAMGNGDTSRALNGTIAAGLIGLSSVIVKFIMTTIGLDLDGAV